MISSRLALRVMFLAAGMGMLSIVYVERASAGDNPITASNTGNWSSAGSHVSNSNYEVGYDGGLLYDYFTFDLSGLNLTGQVVTSATLEFADPLNTGGSAVATSETLNLYGVAGPQTGPETAPNSTPVTVGATTYPSEAQALVGGTNLFGLAEGTVLGGGSVPVTGSENVDISLNSAGLSAITQADGGFFSLGGALAGVNSVFSTTNYVFAGGGSLPVTLDITTEAVPEPTSIAMMGLALFGMGCWYLRRRRIQPVQLSQAMTGAPA